MGEKVNVAGVESSQYGAEGRMFFWASLEPGAEGI